MVSLEGLQEAIGGIGEDVKQFVSEKPVVSAGLGVGVLGATAVGVAGVVKAKAGSKKRKKSSKTTKKTGKGRIKHTKRGWRQDQKRRSKQKWEVAYQRRKKRKGKSIKKTKSRKRVGKTYYTKKGQPYKIMSSGKAKFIKKKRR